MTTAQLWSQESNETKPQTTLTSPILTDIGFNVSSKLILDTKQRNGGAFLPFSKERNLCPSPTLALAACTDEHLELDHKRFSETENGFSCPKRESSGKKMVVIEQGKGAGNSSSSDGQATNTATIASASTNTSTSQTHRKARRCWSPDLHRRFVNALHMLGGSQGNQNPNNDISQVVCHHDYHLYHFHNYIYKWLITCYWQWYLTGFFFGRA
jgi:hypothetical protein